MAVNHVIKGLLALAVALSLTACKTEEPRKSPDTPREAAECVMEKLFRPSRETGIPGIQRIAAARAF